MNKTHPSFRSLRLLAVTSALALSHVPGQAQTVYSADFEPDSQGSAFTTGNVAGQGTPPWAAGFLNQYDNINGLHSVVSGQSYLTGTQALQVAGYDSARLRLDNKVQSQWVEFAFKPNFTAGTPGTAWFATTRGETFDTAGISMFLVWDGENGTILANTGYPPPGGNGKRTWIAPTAGTLIGTFNNGEWQTISFKTDNTVGDYDVFLGSSDTPVATFAPDAFDGVQTLVWSTATGSWEFTGNMYVDGVQIGSESAYVYFPVEGTWTGDSGATWSNSDSLQGEPVVFSEPFGTVAFVNEAGTFFNVPWDNPSNVATQMTDGSGATWARGLVADNWPEVPPQPPVNHWVIDLGESGAPTRQLDSFAMWMVADSFAGGVRADQPMIYVSGDGTDWTLVGKMPANYEGRGPGYNKVAWTFPSGKVTNFRYIMVETGVYPLNFGYKNQAWVEWDGEISSTGSAPTISIARSGGSIEVTWTGGDLESTADLAAGPWTIVPGAVSPYVFTPSEPKRFFRAVRP